VTGACGRIIHPSSRVLRRKKCMSMLRLTRIITWSLVGDSRQDAHDYSRQFAKEQPTARRKEGSGSCVMQCKGVRSNCSRKHTCLSESTKRTHTGMYENYIRSLCDS
jgi:hypothetical protein